MKFKSSLTGLILTSLLLFSTIKSNAQIVTINDADFKTYLLSLVDASGGGNSDGEVQVSEALTRTSDIFYQNSTLTDPTGLEAFTNLTGLYLDNSTLGSTIDLSALTNLETLSLNNTGITSLDLSALTALESLSIGSNNSLTTIDVSDLSQLRMLSANNSGLSTLDMSANGLLEQLRAANNNLSSLNLRNGNNGIITTLLVTNNSSLSCISVDDPTLSSGYAGWSIDASTTYSYFCGDPFVTTWETTGDNETITIPTYSGANYNYYVDWGDGSTDNLQTGNASHEYASAGIQTISIYGAFPRIHFNNGGDKTKIQTISQWGDIQWSSMESAFMGCSNLVSTASDSPDLSQVSSLAAAFAFCNSFDGEIANWDVGNVSNFTGMFVDCALDTDISGWEMDMATNLSQMFMNVTEFNHDLSSWEVSKVTNMSNMFDNSGMSMANYMATLDGWAGLSSLQSEVNVGALGLEYCPSSEGRKTLDEDYSWTFTGDEATTCPFDAETMVQINDDDFKEYLLTLVDDNEDGQVQFTEAEGYDGVISYQNKGLSDPTGLESFTNVLTINFNINALTSLDLSTHTALRNFNISNNDLESLTFPVSAPLQLVELSNNDFETITISGYTLLEQIFLGGNDLTSVNVSNNPVMTRLSINANEFVNWSDINISGSTGITLLEVQANPHLLDLDVSGLSSLSTLYAQQTSITELDLSMNEQLVTANISSAGGGTLTYINIQNGNNAELTTFNVANNPDLDCIVVDDITDAESNEGWQKPATARYTLACGPKLVSVYPLDGSTDFPILSEIRLTFNEPIQIGEGLSTGDLRIQPSTKNYYDMTDESTLEVIDENTLVIRPYLLNNTPRIDHDTEYYLTMASGVVMDMDGNEFEGWTDAETYNFTTETEAESLARYESFSPANDETGISTELTQISIEITNISEVNGGTLRLFGAGNALIKEWDLSGSTDFEIDGNFVRFTNLPELSPNQLHWVQLIGHRSTWGYTYGSFVKSTGEHLQAWGNDRIWEFTTASGPTVTINDDGLRAYLVDLVDANNGGDNDGFVQVSEAENFTGAIQYKNQSLSDVTGLEAFINITELDLETNDISSYDPSVHPELTTLNLNVNNLSSIDVSSNTDLVDLRLADNSLTSIDLEFNTQLEVLYLFTNEIAQVDVSDLTGLRVLAIQNMPELTALDVTNNTLIEELEFYSTSIGEIDLTNLSELTYLDITDLEIDYLDLSGKNKLEYLYADNSSLSYLNLKTGNHELIDEVTLTGCVNLTCVEVDNVSYANTNWTDIDEGLTFNTSCRDEQSITFGALEDMVFGDEPLALSATASSSLSVSYSVISGPGEVTGSTLTITGAGEITIAADQAGDTDFEPAEQVTRVLSVAKADQTISIETIADQPSTATPFMASATVDSGLPLTYEVSGPATVSGTEISLTGEAGTVTLTVSQAGNENYNAASAEITFDIILDEVLSVANNEPKVSIYPNPAIAYVQIDGHFVGQVQAQLFDSRGLQVIYQDLDNSREVSLHGLKDGLYLMKISDEQKTTTTRLLIQR